MKNKKILIIIIGVFVVGIFIVLVQQFNVSKQRILKSELEFEEHLACSKFEDQKKQFNGDPQRITLAYNELDTLTILDACRFGSWRCDSIDWPDNIDVNNIKNEQELINGLRSSYNRNITIEDVKKELEQYKINFAKEYNEYYLPRIIEYEKAEKECNEAKKKLESI